MLFEQEDRCYVSNYNIATVGKSAPASCVLCKYPQCSLIANTSHKLFFFPLFLFNWKLKQFFRSCCLSVHALLQISPMLSWWMVSAPLLSLCTHDVVLKSLCASCISANSHWSLKHPLLPFLPIFLSWFYWQLPCPVCWCVFFLSLPTCCPFSFRSPSSLNIFFLLIWWKKGAMMLKLPSLFFNQPIQRSFGATVCLLISDFTVANEHKLLYINHACSL